MALEDDEWAMRRLREWIAAPSSRHDMVGEGSFRYPDEAGVVHRAWWVRGRWESLCGIKNPTQKLQEKDPGPVTCIQCHANGA